MPPILELLPNELAFLADTGAIPSTPETYVCLPDGRDGKKSKLPVGTAFSPDLLVLSTGVACYKEIIAQLCERGSPPQASGEIAAVARMTSHGWAELLPMRKLIRKLGFTVLPPLGWLLEYPVRPQRRISPTMCRSLTSDSSISPSHSGWELR